MDFANSSQCRRWLFTADALTAQRQQAREDFLNQCKAAAFPAIDADPDLISFTEEIGLLRHYQEKLIAVCTNLKLPRKVLSTAINFLKRFYLKRSSLETDPQQMALTCLYVACKTEDCYISAAELGRLVGMPADVLLRSELVLLQGLDFDLQIHSFYRALEGCFADVSEWSNTGNGQHALSAAQFQDLKMAANQTADHLLLSDAPLLFTPGQMGLSAVRFELLKKFSDIDFQSYLQHMAASHNGSSGGAAAAVALSKVLDLIDAEAAVTPLQHEEVVDVDRKLKSLRKKLIAAGVVGKKKEK